jgi:glycosyltransferase involved in cell wall biosynthesis
MAPVPIACLTIFGENREPFLASALRSVAWVDYFAIVNTAAADVAGRQNEHTMRGAISAAKLRYDHYQARRLSFAEARNRALELIEPGHFVLLVDADDVHYPELEPIVRALVHGGADCVSAMFWHLMVYKDLYQGVMPREIVFRRYDETRFDGCVHEQLITPRHARVDADYRYVHYGYIKPQHEVFRRWRRYAELEGEPDRYAGVSPDHILDERVKGCHRFPGAHPPAVREALTAFPSYFRV